MDNGKVVTIDTLIRMLKITGDNWQDSGASNSQFEQVVEEDHYRSLFSHTIEPYFNGISLRWWGTLDIYHAKLRIAGFK